MAATGVLRALCVVGILAAGASGCSTVKIRVPVTHPSEVNLKDVDTLAIMGFEGKGGTEIADELGSAVFEAKYHKLVDRQALDAILREQSLQMSGSVDAGSAVKIGKVLGAAALVFGRVTKHDYDEKVTSQQVTYYENKQKYTGTQYTRKGVGRVAAAFSVVSCQTGRVLATKRLEKAYEASTSALNGTPAGIDGDELVSTAQATVVKEFMKAIAPWREEVEVAFRKNGDLPELEQGITYARNGDWAQATTLFETARKKAEGNPKLQGKPYGCALVDLGFAYQYTDRFDDAITTFKKAYEVTKDETYLAQVREVEKRKKEVEELAKQAKVEE